jgi:hypothetical protein
MSLILNVYGLDTCEKCQEIKNTLLSSNIVFNFLNGNETRYSNHLDIMDVNFFPFVEIVKNNKVIWFAKEDIKTEDIIQKYNEFK